MEFNSSFDQTNFLGYCLPSQYDSIHYPNGGWEYHQELTNSEQFNQWEYASEPTNEQDNFMRYCPTPQNDSCHYANGGWEYQQEMIEDISLECAFNKFMQDYPPMPQDDPYCDEFNNSSSCA
ncbi:hypothetical protein AHAS_Ahas11G0190400 [Arachis hypogaea]